MGSKTQRSLEERVVHAAEAALTDHHYVSAIDVFLGLAWLASVHVEDWRKDRAPCLEDVIQAGLGQVSRVMAIFRGWAQARGLKPSETAYLARTRGPRRELRFSKSGDPGIEKAYRTHYVSPALSEAKTARLRKKMSQPPELVVFSTLRDSQCAECGAELPQGSLLFMEGGRPLCLACADLDHLLHLPRGDAALTRRAGKHSALSAVVVRFSRARKRYERQGLLVEESALAKAEEECLSDEALRARRREREALRRSGEDKELAHRMAARILELFPGCPPEEALAIARHTTARGSGRIGRSAAARELEADSATLAVVAWIRHHHTNYDELLMESQDRLGSREQVRGQIEDILWQWRAASPGA